MYIDTKFEVIFCYNLLYVKFQLLYSHFENAKF